MVASDSRNGSVHVCHDVFTDVGVAQVLMAFVSEVRQSHASVHVWSARVRVRHGGGAIMPAVAQAIAAPSCACYSKAKVTLAHSHAEPAMTAVSAKFPLTTAITIPADSVAA